MTDQNVLPIAQLLAVAALSAIAASGLTTLALIAFFRNLLGSPAALKLVEGLVNSFPPDTRELINVIARFVETVSEDGTPPAAGTQPAPQPMSPPQGPLGGNVAQILHPLPNPYSVTSGQPTAIRSVVVTPERYLS